MFSGSDRCVDCGIPWQNGCACLFSKSLLTNRFNLGDHRNVYHDIDVKPERIFVACDPNTDGLNYTGIASGFWTPGKKLVVLGLDLVLAEKTASRDEAIRKHVTSIRTMINGAYANVPIIFIPEDSSGHAVRLVEHMGDLSRIATIREPGRRNFGVRMTQLTMRESADTLDNILFLGQLMFSSEMFSDSSTSLDEIVREYMRQLSLMCHVINSAGIHGKIKAECGAVTFCMLSHFSKSVNESADPAYESLRIM